MKTLSDIQAARVAAIKTGYKQRASALSLLSSEVQKIAKDDGNREPTNADVIQAARRNIKRTEETASYTKDNGQLLDLMNEIEVYKEFLPQQLTTEELTHAIKLAIAGVPITSGAGMGAIMKYLRAHHEGQFDSKDVKPLLDSIQNGLRN